MHSLPAVGAPIGLAAHAAAMSIGYGYDVGYATLGLIGAVVAAVAAFWASRASHRLARVALVLALGSALTLPGWWSGWPAVLGASAVTTGLAAARATSAPRALAWTGTTIGAICAGASLAFCVSG